MPLRQTINLKAVAIGFLTAAGVTISGILLFLAAAKLISAPIALWSEFSGMVFVATICAGVGGYVTGRLARSAELVNGLALGVLCLCVSLYNLYDTYVHPMTISDGVRLINVNSLEVGIFSLVSVVPIVLLGAYCARRKSFRSATNTEAAVFDGNAFVIALLFSPIVLLLSTGECTCIGFPMPWQISLDNALSISAVGVLGLYWLALLVPRFEKFKKYKLLYIATALATAHILYDTWIFS